MAKAKLPKKLVDLFVPASELPADIAKVGAYDLLRIKKYPDFDDVEWHYALAIAEKKGLDPLLDQIIFEKRPSESDFRKKEIAYIITVEAFRIIADRTGTRGSAGPAIIAFDDAGWPISATYTTENKVDGEWKNMTATVYADELETATTSKFSKDMRKTWLGKCAEVASLRLGWPQDLGRLYLREEIAAVTERQQKGQAMPPMDAVDAIPPDDVQTIQYDA
jgi:hypothetical protein